MKQSTPDASPAKPPLLLISRNFPPLLGGMERLNQRMLIELAHCYETGLVGPCGAQMIDAIPAHLWECPSAPLGNFIFQAACKAIAAARRLQPRIVLAGSGLTAPLAWLAARICGARCIVYLHGLDVEVKQPVYQWLWPPFFRHFDRVVVNSRFTRQLAVEAGVPADRISILHPGVTLPELREARQMRRAFREAHDLGSEPVMLYVGRITARKGLSVFAEQILPDIIRHCPSAHLLVIGDTPSLALLRQNDERQRVKEALAANGLGERVRFLGSTDDEELRSAYFAADVLIFPVQARPHDNEGFGMVAMEAAAHGLPTVAFAAGGVADAVADGVSGRLIPAGDNAAFARAVIETLSAASKSHYSRSCCHFSEPFSWSAFGEGIRAICRDVEEVKKR